MADPVENRWSSSFHGASGTNNMNAPSFSDWDPGEPDSSPDVHRGFLSSTNYVVDHRSEDREFDFSSDLLHENCTSVYGSSHPIGRNTTHHSSSNRTLGIVSSSGANHNLGGGSSSSYSSGDSRGKQDESSSLGTWGFACKRKALEVSSGKFCSGGSSSSNPQPDNIVRRNVPLPHNLGSSSLTMLSSDAAAPEHANSRNRTSTSSNGITESSMRNFDPMESFGNQDSVSFALPRPFSLTSARDSLHHHLSLTMNSSNSANQSPQRSGYSVPYNSSSNSSVRGDSSFRSSYNGDHSRYFSGTEAINGDNWNSANLFSSQIPPPTQQTFPTRWDANQNPTTRTPPRLSDIAPWAVSPPPSSENGTQSEVNFVLQPWTANPSEDPFPPLPWPSTSSEEPETSSRHHRRANRQPYLRSSMISEGPRLSTRSNALPSDYEGRLRVATELRQMLNAMQRSENFQAEDYMAFNPFINGGASHDRHRDMRLDVDNMSYEELLALGEQIGNVNTGLSEATILAKMNQRKYESINRGLSPDLEPCCICREEYVTSDNIGTLVCGHEFHTNCIKKWLMLKNLCPICKKTGLET